MHIKRSLKNLRNIRGNIKTFNKSFLLHKETECNKHILFSFFVKLKFHNESRLSCHKNKYFLKNFFFFFFS